MKKKEILNMLKTHNYIVKKKKFNSYDFEVVTKQNTYSIKIINLTSNHLVTINSSTVWQIKRGKISGLKFQELDSNLINIKRFLSCENKIIMFSEKPYKVLKHVNESDLVDISNQDIVNETLVTANIEKVLDYIK